jgi:hypothetical protein
VGHAGAGTTDPYCKFDNQILQWFTSSLFIAGVFAALPAGYTTRCLAHLEILVLAHTCTAVSSALFHQSRQPLCKAALHVQRWHAMLCMLPLAGAGGASARCCWPACCSMRAWR